jgi:prepilin peptidase CpaA
MDPVAQVVISLCALAAALYDLRQRRIPNALVILILVLGVAFAMIGWGAVHLIQAGQGAALGALIFLPGFLWGFTGGGDLKLGLAYGAWLGPEGFFVAYCVALGVALLWILGRQLAASVRDRLSAPANLRTGLDPANGRSGLRSGTIPFAPALGVGCLVSALLPDHTAAVLKGIGLS